MTGKYIAVCGLALSLASLEVFAAEKPRRAVRCADLQWSEEVLASNPDIDRMCQGVFEKDNVLYAKATIEVVRVVGNALTFRPVHTDGNLGKRRKIDVDGEWSVTIGGRRYRLSDLTEGQQVNVYLPQDRFSLTTLSPAGSGQEESEPGESQPGESEPGESEPGESEPGESEPGESEPGESEPGESEP